MTLSNGANGHPAPSALAGDVLAEPTGSSSLWFNPTVFLQEDFDVDTTIAEFRRYVPLSTLSSELLNYLSTLKTKLVEVVNEDYGDYVSLSTRLINVDGAVLRMRKPLLDLKEKTVVVHDAVKSELLALNQGLKKRKDVAVARSLLELLQDVAHVGQKVEKLLAEVAANQPGEADGKEDLDSSSRMLERVAGEVSRLSFLAAQGKDLAFVKAMEPRVAAARSSLESRLSEVLRASLSQANWPASLHCLNAFAELGDGGPAEGLVRRVLVAPLLHKLIMQHKHAIQHNVGGQAFAGLLTAVLEGVKEQLGPLLEVSLGPSSGLHVFNFLSNSVLAEVAQQISDQLPGVFSPGIPATFHANYHAALAFTASLETLCGSRALVDKFRGSGAYGEFFKRWNLQVYFSVVFNEVAGKLEAALQQQTGLQQAPPASPTKTAPASPTKAPSSPSKAAAAQQLRLSCSRVLWDCLLRCLDARVVIGQLADRFLKLALQLVARYSYWVQQVVRSRRAAVTGAEPELAWASELSLEDLAVPLADASSIAAMLRTHFTPALLQLLPDVPTEVAQGVREALQESEAALLEQRAALQELIVAEVADKCMVVLNQLKGISATYRVTSKGPPSHHSFYVTGILKDLKAYLDLPSSASWTAEYRSGFVRQAVEVVTQQYQILAEEMLTTVRKREISLKRLKKTRADESQGDVNAMSDSEKIGLQLLLDVKEFGRQVHSLGCDPTQLPAYQRLWEAVAPSSQGQAISLT